MLRRVLFIVSLTALGVAGAASAGLVGSRATPSDPLSSFGPPPSGTSQLAATTTAGATTTTAPVTPSAVRSTVGVSAAPSTLVVSGHGWGHGVGMSQYGALGFAQHGWTYDRILAHYYRGTTLEQRPSPTVRVLLLEGAPRVTLASESPWSVKDAQGMKVVLPPGETVISAGLVLDGRKLASPLAFTAGRTPLSVAGKPYRGGLLVISNGKLLQVVNTLKLEPYVMGVVGHEMPSSWPTAALQVQAVAARTYALASLTTVVTARTYDLFSDTRSQVYGGIEAESPSVSKAVAATSRQVVLHAGKPITAYYSSSSGGRTASATEAFGQPIPYLVSVRDPYDTLSPNHSWGPVLYDTRAVAKALKVDGGLLDLRATPGPSGHVSTVTAVGAGGEIAVTAAAIRTLLGLRSTWFDLGWLALDPPLKAAYGVATELSGVARGAGAVTLESRSTGGGWQTVGPVTPDASGGFEMTVRPQATTQYRLAAGEVRGALVSVPVEPVVDAFVNAGAVSGTVRPALPGSAVQLQRQSGTSWATVATATPDTSGSFALAASLGPGSYRVRWAPGRGLAPGVSRQLAVS